MIGDLLHILQCVWKSGKPMYSFKLQLWGYCLTAPHWPNIWPDAGAHLVDSGKFGGCRVFHVVFNLSLCH